MSPPLGLHPATAAAVATGGEVSDAVLALQFQDIDANDFEALLTLDEQGGVGGRTCGGGRGLSEQVVEDLLRSGKVAAGGLEESCAICLVGYEVGEEVLSRIGHCASIDMRLPVFFYVFFVNASFGVHQTSRFAD